MHKLSKLKKMLVEELEQFADSNSLTKNSLEMIDILAHATKNLVKVMESCEGDEFVAAEKEDRATKEELMKLIEKL